MFKQAKIGLKSDINSDNLRDDSFTYQVTSCHRGPEELRILLSHVSCPPEDKDHC